MKSTSKNIKVIGIIITMSVIIACGGLFYRYYDGVKSEVVVEVGGEKPTLEMFLKNKNNSTSFITDIENIDMNSVNKHDIEIKVGLFTRESVLSIIDTKAPVVKLKNVEKYKNHPLEINEFVESIYDYSDFEIKYKEEPDLTKIGDQEVVITVKDEWGNETVEYGMLKVLEDKIAPVINGTKNQTVYLKSTLSYKSGVSAVDNVDGEVEVKVDSSKVNLNKVGGYEVIYTAVDKAGNSTEVVRTITVVEKPSGNVDLAKLDELSDKVLAQITNDNMTQVQKANAIHKWVKSSIRYTGTSNKESWVKGAYQGLTQKAGDCYTYYATARQLLTRAGIPNLSVTAEKNKHYWNMVNCGTGWYHFDATQFIGNPNIFMYTDEKIENLYITGTRRHIWDKSTTPRTPEK